MRFQLNIDKLMFETDGVWDMPLLEAAQTTFTGAEEVIPFNYAITERQPQNKGVHFFLDDYQFERVWTCPEKYGEILKKHGFRWSPTQEAWQRQLTPNAEYSIDYVIRDFNKLTDNT